jgi:ADP-ribose pyrophosphatase YjhB (NUDIX family)
MSSSSYPIVAVNAVIFDSSDRVLLTRRVDNGLWCLPGGLVEFGETVVQALLRELDEEVGVRPTHSELTGVYSSNNVEQVSTAGRSSIILAFRCDLAGQVPGTSDEVSAAHYFELAGLPLGIVENHSRRAFDAAHRSGVPVVD